MSATSEQLAAGVEKVVECFGDGFQFSDLLTAVRVAAEIAETYSGMPGDEKKDFVLEVIRQAYRKVDPDIPWLPGFVETPLENLLLDTLVPAALEFLIDFTKKGVKVNHAEA